VFYLIKKAIYVLLTSKNMHRKIV